MYSCMYLSVEFGRGSKNVKLINVVQLLVCSRRYKSCDAALAPAEGIKPCVCSDALLHEKFDSNQSIPIQTKDIL